MQLWYNGIALHALGTLEGGVQRWEPLPDAQAPMRMRTTLRVTLHFFETTFGANRELADSARDALETTRATLRWYNDATGTTYYNGEAAVGPYEWPDTGKGNTRHQSLQLEFSWFEQEKAGPYLSATFRNTESEVAVSLGRVTQKSERYSANRYSERHSVRSGAGGQITLSGEYPADTSLALSARATALEALKEQWIEEIDGADGVLTYSTFDRTVRVESFEANLNAGMDTLVWSLAASFTRFPDETNGVLVEYDVATNEDTENGAVTVVLSGRIGAPTALLCKTKLETIRDSVRAAQPSGVTLNKLKSELTEHSVIGDSDGEAFIELRFSETYRATKEGEIVEWSLTISDNEDPKTGAVQRTYSGMVKGKSSANWAAAYAAAVAKAKLLGAGKHQALLSGKVQATDKEQSGSDYPGLNTERFCNVDFEWTYKLTQGAHRVWVEITSEAQHDTFGQDRETVSGSVMAHTAQVARGLYATIKAGYTGSLIESERVSEKRVKVKANSALVGGTLTPPAYAGGDIVNTGEVLDDTAESVMPAPVPTNPPLLGSGYVRQWEGLTFSLTLFIPKSSSRVALRYEQRTVSDYIRRVTEVRYSGTVWVDSSVTGQAVIDALLPPSKHWLTKEVGEERGKFFRSWTDETDNQPATDPEEDKPGYLYQMTFSAGYTERLTGDNALIEVELTDEYQHSGPRFVVRPTAFGRDVIQACGYASGTRTIRGSAVATTEAIAAAWCRTQYNLSWSAALGISTAPTAYSHPPRFTTQPTWVQLEDAPTARGESSNVAAWRVSFEYTCVMPDFDAVMEETPEVE